jgi:hypothetical protein
MLPEKVYVQSKPDENHYEGELLNGSYIFPGESREEKLNEVGTFIYDGSNGFGSYYIRGAITVVNETTQEKKIPIEIPTTVPKSKKSYQLIIYLDNASPQNVIGDNFKILVYNSNNEPILSAKPNIDFNDDHQKISPRNGYPIIYQSGQYPKEINVCAQQEYQLNGTTNLHNDCYPIIQNVQKTYWYTTFDYAEIDGIEPDSNSIAKSKEMTPANVTLTPENKSESNNQSSSNITGTDQSNSTSNSTVSDIPNGSEIVLLSQKLKKASFGLRHVIGQVKNIGPETADYVEVHLTTYNKDGEVIGTAFTFAEPSTLKSGQKSTFEISADTDNFKGMDHYELSLDWLNHRDSAQGYVEDAQLYKSTPN